MSRSHRGRTASACTRRRTPGAATRSGLYRSDNGGASWRLATTQILSAGGGPIYVDPKNPDVMYLMGTACTGPRWRTHRRRVQGLARRGRPTRPLDRPHQSTSECSWAWIRVPASRSMAGRRGHRGTTCPTGNSITCPRTATSPIGYVGRSRTAAPACVLESQRLRRDPRQ